MNKKFAEFLSWMDQKNIAVVGMGISNRPLIEILAKRGLKLTVFDALTEDAEPVRILKAEYAKSGYDINWQLGPDYLEKLKGFDLIFRTPSLMPYREQIIREKERGALVTSEMEVFLHCCPGQTFGITGSDGKSTTTSLTYSMLKAQGFETYIGGNIGRPLLSDLDQMTADAKVVVELSSFQLVDMTLSPNVSILTNVTPNHLNIHKDLADYVTAKKQIYRHQKLGDRLILNGLCPEFAADRFEVKSEITWFNDRYPGCRQMVFVEKAGQLGFRARNSEVFEPVCPTSDLHIMGNFNRQNVLAAMAATHDFVETTNMAKAVASFKGLEHRLEFVREIAGVKYYNSSIDSSPERSKHSIAAFSEAGKNLVLIMGGKDKNCDYSGLGKIIAGATDRLILCGANADLITNAVRLEAGQAGKTLAQIQIVTCHDYPEAVAVAQSLAGVGDSVLLSPAGTSFDQFSNFMERGQVFKHLVNQLR